MMSRWRRPTQFLGSLVLLGALLACGSNSGSVGETDPPGQVIAGTGPVADQADATQRVLTQFLGLTTSRQTGSTVVGTGDDPFVNLYSAADDALPRGTQVTDEFAELTTITLNRRYFLFWVDPNPPAKLGHTTSLLFVDSSDGRIIETPAEFGPRMGDATPLLFQEDKEARLLYTHQIWLDEMAEAPPLTATRQALGNGQNAHGLFVSGHYDFTVQADIDSTANYLQDITGEANPLSLLLDRKNDRTNKDELEDAVKSATRDLGAGDKFYFVISSHGSSTGKVRVGSDLLTWAEICKILSDNVTAQYINVVADTCYAGFVNTVFPNWDAETDKGVRWITATDSTHPAYGGAAGSWGIKCTFAKLTEALGGDREDGNLTVAEIEQAMADLELSFEEIRQKICDKWQERNPAWWNDFEVDSGPGDKRRPTGEPQEGGFDPAPPPPVEVPQHILDLLEQLRRARLADDPIQLGPLYDPNYNYDGQTHQQITQVNPSFDVTAFTIGEVRLDTLGGDDIVIVDIDRTIEVHGTQPIRSEQQGTRVFEIDPIEPQDILSERLARWAQQDFGGALGLQAQPPGAPVIQPPVVVGGTPFQVDSFFDVFVEIHLADHPGNIRVSGGVTFQPRQRQLTGTQVDGVFASLAGNTVQLQREGSTDIYSGDIAVPRQLGRWVLSFSASSRIANGQTGDFVSSAAGRSVEIRVVP